MRDARSVGEHHAWAKPKLGFAKPNGTLALRDQFEGVKLEARGPLNAVVRLAVFASTAPDEILSRTHRPQVQVVTASLADLSRDEVRLGRGADGGRHGRMTILAVAGWQGNSGHPLAHP